MSTDALALLDGAVSVLRGIAPGLSSDAKYAVLLAANAVATARRDVALAERSAAGRAGLPPDPSAIRSGAYDADAALYDSIFAHAALRAWIADPASLTDAERAAQVEGGSG